MFRQILFVLNVLSIWSTCLLYTSLGTFQIGVSGKGADSEDKYDVSMINKARINFRPGLALSGMLTALSFSKVNKLPKKEEKKPEEEVSGVNEG